MKYINNLFRFFLPPYEVVYQTSKHPELIHKRSFQAEIFYRFIPMTFFISWLFTFIPVVGDFLFLFLILLGAFYMYLYSDLKSEAKTTLLYLIVSVWGFLGIWSFVGHTIFADMVADSIGWETGSPFQIELAFYHLGLALASISLLWTKERPAYLAVILAKATFLFGAMGVHIYHAIQYENFSLGNLGVRIILADLVIPIIIILLYRRAFRKYE